MRPVCRFRGLSTMLTTCNVRRTDLSTSLSSERPTVSTYLEAWQATMDWESQMERRFGMAVSEGQFCGTCAVVADDMRWLSSSIFRTTCLCRRHSLLQCHRFSSRTSGYLSTRRTSEKHSCKSYRVSSALTEPFKFCRAFEDMLSQHRGARSRSSLEGAAVQVEDAASLKVLPSSTELFYLYGQALDQCQKYTTGQGMKELADVFAKWLGIYSGEKICVWVLCLRLTERYRGSLDSQHETVRTRITVLLACIDT